MAAGHNSNAIYYGISNGKIFRQFQAPTPRTVERTNKNGKTVYEEFYDYLDGLITDIETKENDYGKFWVITLMDGGEKQILQFNYSSGYANGFLKALPNVDLSCEVKLIPKSTKEGDKTKTTLFVNQHGRAIKWAFTKEHPNGLPELKQVKVKGKVTWDDSDVMEFLDDMVKNKVVPQLKAKKYDVVAETVNVTDDEQEPYGNVDLPF